MSDSSQHEEAVLKAKESLERVQEFDTQSLIRLSDLGKKFAFKGAVEPANRLTALFQKLPSDTLTSFPEQQLNVITQRSNSIFNIFSEILSFEPDEPNATTTRESLLKSLEQSHQSVFNDIFPFISFAVARTVDFNELSQQGRAAVQSVRDETSRVVSELKDTSASAEKVLAEVREAAAEQGVTQQARYFETEAKSHEDQSVNWRTGVFVMSAIVLAYAVGTLFFPQVEILRADTVAESIQLTVSKVLVFFVLVSILLLFVRNFTAHKHNGIINRHRQNALMTYTTLAEAGNSTEARDTVLQHAAAAIYAPNDSGYVRNEERGYSNGAPVALSARVPAVGSNSDG